MSKKILSILPLALVLSLIISSAAFAHSQKSAVTQADGWMIDESYHTNSTTFYYKFDSHDINMTTDYKNIVKEGASKWSNYGSISESSSAIGTIKAIQDTTNYGIAWLDIGNSTTDSNGHFTSWKIYLNIVRPVTSKVIAHEFGHVYGLNDLYSDANSNKLMYGYDTSTATGPTSADIMGQKVITGIHWYHTYSYKQEPNVASTVPIHRKYCTYCEGYIDEPCSPQHGTCTICNFYHP